MRDVKRLCVLLLLATISSHALAQEHVLEIGYRPTRRAQVAIWIERQDGTFFRTLLLTDATARRGIGNRPGAMQMNSGYRWPYGRREGVLPYWAHRRASAADAQLFRRVIFQDRLSEGHASRSSNDSSTDNHFCLSFNTATTSRNALDAVACASVFNSDKGRFATASDVARQYSEPYAETTAPSTPRLLDTHSLYPPRRDVERCSGSSSACFDHADVAMYGAEARRVIPEIDAITRPTPAGDQLRTDTYTWPSEWGSGDFYVMIEVNVEGDYNQDMTWGPLRYPTPRNRDQHNDWDYWALNYGYPYRGQPSIVYRVPFSIGNGSRTTQTIDALGYADLAGATDVLHDMDNSIARAVPGSGIARLSDQDGFRVRVNVMAPEACTGNVAPSTPTNFAVTTYGERRDAHHFAHVRFQAPHDDLGVRRYELRYSVHPIDSEETFISALPGQAATLESVAITIPVSAAEGDWVDVDVGGLTYQTHYYFALRAVDGCNQSSPFVTSEHSTLPIEFTTVSPCFVATAAYGTPMADDIQVLRRFRDERLMQTRLGRAVVSAYYAVGPYLAAQIATSELEREWTRNLLQPVVWLARKSL